LSGLGHAIAVTVMAVAVVLTVITGLDYISRAFRLRRLSQA